MKVNGLHAVSFFQSINRPKLQLGYPPIKEVDKFAPIAATALLVTVVAGVIFYLLKNLVFKSSKKPAEIVPPAEVVKPAEIIPPTGSKDIPDIDPIKTEQKKDPNEDNPSVQLCNSLNDIIFPLAEGSFLEYARMRTDYNVIDSIEQKLSEGEGFSKTIDAIKQMISEQTNRYAIYYITAKAKDYFIENFPTKEHLDKFQELPKLPNDDEILIEIYAAHQDNITFGNEISINDFLPLLTKESSKILLSRLSPNSKMYQAIEALSDQDEKVGELVGQLENPMEKNIFVKSQCDEIKKLMEGGNANYLSKMPLPIQWDIGLETGLPDLSSVPWISNAAKTVWKFNQGLVKKKSFKECYEHMPFVPEWANRSKVYSPLVKVGSINITTFHQKLCGFVRDQCESLLLLEEIKRSYQKIEEAESCDLTTIKDELTQIIEKYRLALPVEEENDTIVSSDLFQSIYMANANDFRSRVLCETDESTTKNLYTQILSISDPIIRCNAAKKYILTLIESEKLYDAYYVSEKVFAKTMRYISNENPQSLKIIQKLSELPRPVNLQDYFLTGSSGSNKEFLMDEVQFCDLEAKIMIALMNLFERNSQKVRFTADFLSDTSGKEGIIDLFDNQQKAILQFYNRGKDLTERLNSFKQLDKDTQIDFFDDFLKELVVALLEAKGNEECELVKQSFTEFEHPPGIDFKKWYLTELKSYSLVDSSFMKLIKYSPFNLDLTDEDKVLLRESILHFHLDEVGKQDLEKVKEDVKDFYEITGFNPQEVFPLLIKQFVENNKHLGGGRVQGILRDQAVDEIQTIMKTKDSSEDLNEEQGGLITRYFGKDWKDQTVDSEVAKIKAQESVEKSSAFNTLKSHRSTRKRGTASRKKRATMIFSQT